MTTASSVLPLFYIYRKTVDHKTQTVLTEVHKKEKNQSITKIKQEKTTKDSFSTKCKLSCCTQWKTLQYYTYLKHHTKKITSKVLPKVLRFENSRTSV